MIPLKAAMTGKGPQESKEVKRTFSKHRNSPALYSGNQVHESVQEWWNSAAKRQYTRGESNFRL